MKRPALSCKTAIAAMKAELHSPSHHLKTYQAKREILNKDLASKILNRKWMLPIPNTEINRVTLSVRKKLGRGSHKLFNGISFSNHTNKQGGFQDDSLGADSGEDRFFYVVRDDLLHPLVNGNKARKLDALIPLLVGCSVTDVVTCGGCQSAHAAAVAVSCSEQGVKSHLLLRGEQPEVLTGYNLVSTMYGDVTYVPRSVYTHREETLKGHANLVAGSKGCVLSCDDIVEASFATSKFGQKHVAAKTEKDCRIVAIINEGAGDAIALLGVIRLVEYLCQDHLFGSKEPVKLVVDAGTGTTAIGLGLGALLLSLPWEVTGVMLADSVDAYQQKEKSLVSDFLEQFGSHHSDDCLNEGDDRLVNWVERRRQRKFGNILESEMEVCQQVAQQTGILVDPVYTLAAWETASELSKEPNNDARIVMLHTGGTLGMFGLAQRYKSYFSGLGDGRHPL